jgi:hypothetical protein
MSHQAYDVVDVDDAGTVALPENSGVRPFGLFMSKKENEESSETH